MQAEPQSRTAPRWEDPPSLIQNILAEHLASRSRVRQLGRRRLSPGLKGLIWFLRLYVLFMVAVMTVNVLQTLH
jgi:hypothetical protein